MKKLSLLLASLLSFSTLSACNNNQVQNLPLNNQVVVSSTDHISNQYIVTARAIVDRMAKTTNKSEQEKLAKDFADLLKSSNRPTLEGILQYSVKVAQATTPAGGDIKSSPVISLIYVGLDRYLDIIVKSRANKLSMEIFLMAIEENDTKREEMLKKFEGYSLNSVPKMDIRGLIDFIKGKNSNMGDYLDPQSELAKRLLTKLEQYL